jgi:hypothetical protein
MIQPHNTSGNAIPASTSTSPSSYLEILQLLFPSQKYNPLVQFCGQVPIFLINGVEILKLLQISSAVSTEAVLHEAFSQIILNTISFTSQENLSSINQEFMTQSLPQASLLPPDYVDFVLKLSEIGSEPFEFEDQIQNEIFKGSARSNSQSAIMASFHIDNTSMSNSQLYLDTISRIFLHYEQFQVTDAADPLLGRIIDQHKKTERQYATPAFAHTGARLLQARYFIDPQSHQRVLYRVALAMDASIASLAYGISNLVRKSCEVSEFDEFDEISDSSIEGNSTPVGNAIAKANSLEAEFDKGEHTLLKKGFQNDQANSLGCGQNHCNFYLLHVILAISALEGIADPDTIAHWKTELKALNSERMFEDWPHRRGNWGFIAAAGEWMRFDAGLRESATDIDSQLESSVPALWSHNGVFLDDSGCERQCSPTAYDTYAKL